MKLSDFNRYAKDFEKKHTKPGRMAGLTSSALVFNNEALDRMRRESISGLAAQQRTMGGFYAQSDLAQYSNQTIPSSLGNILGVR